VRGLRSYLGWKLKAGLVLTGVAAVGSIPARPGDPNIARWRSGDVLFLNGTSLRSRAVRLLQGYTTDYSHVGIVVVDEGVPFVIHADPAAGKVIKQRWDAVIRSGQVSGGAVYRVRGADARATAAACAVARQHAREDAPFDNDFDLRTVDRLFCTELVWRAYRSAGVDLCKDAETNYPHLLPAALLKSPELGEILRF